jgi:hypothetical protein
MSKEYLSVKRVLRLVPLCQNGPYFTEYIYVKIDLNFLQTPSFAHNQWLN